MRRAELGPRSHGGGSPASLLPTPAPSARENGLGWPGLTRAHAQISVKSLLKRLLRLGEASRLFPTPQADASALSIFFTAQQRAASMKPSRLIMRAGQRSPWTESILC